VTRVILLKIETQPAKHITLTNGLKRLFTGISLKKFPDYNHLFSIQNYYIILGLIG